VERVDAGWKVLEQEVVQRWERADAARKGAERGWEVGRLGRGVTAALWLARRVETDVGGAATAGARGGKEEWSGLVGAAESLVRFKGLWDGELAEQLRRVDLVKAVKRGTMDPSEEKVRARAQQVVREFALSSLTPTQGAGTTFAQAEDAKARTAAAVQILYLLSPVHPRPASLSSSSSSRKPTAAEFQPELLLRSLQHYLHTALQASSASAARALATLPTLDRALAEVSARCQNIVALEDLLSSVRPPAHPLLEEDEDGGGDGGGGDHSARANRDGDEAEAEGDADDDDEDSQANLLQPLLHSLDTPSLPSYFWRSLASSLGPRVHDILARGGASARALRANRDKVRDDIRQCVLQGSRRTTTTPPTLKKGGQGNVETSSGAGWEREAAVMVGSVVGALCR